MKLRRALSTAALVFVMFFNVSGGAFTTETLIVSVGPGLGLLLLILVPLFWSLPETLIIGELVPKRLALQNAERGSGLVLDESDARIDVVGHPVERHGTCVHGLLLSGTGQCPIRHRRLVPAYSHRCEDAIAGSTVSGSRSDQRAHCHSPRWARRRGTHAVPTLLAAL